ncbi:hypothetical protein Cs7R123_02220 [Catellatospora sp. TT07R-123]|uniref:NRDE family protein n=1 Tax=Catellatospora sp. TT07R-123 TaxID=2733863 RepID=UPI001B2A6744|nr:NRDE family protein [Catellatospora sp. TT07R-123]GHJ42880.1 hypothetical protein Cs7R123_02220 [Catellatospora sp. TT07R-123]
MCTAIISVDPGARVPVLLAAVRDELAGRAWDLPGAHWPDRPGIVAGRDRAAGGTWLAVQAADGRVACLLNGFGRGCPGAARRSRGELPLAVAAGEGLDRARLPCYDPFHLVTADTDTVVLSSWDGAALRTRRLGAGLHLIVNSGLEGRDDQHPGNPTSPADMAARVAHFRPLLLAAPRPDPDDGTTAEAWAGWLPVVEGGGLAPADPRALLIRRTDRERRVFRSQSVSLLAIGDGTVRYDFTAAPATGTWHRVPVDAALPMRSRR